MYTYMLVNIYETPVEIAPWMGPPLLYLPPAPLRYHLGPPLRYLRGTPLRYLQPSPPPPPQRP